MVTPATQAIVTAGAAFEAARAAFDAKKTELNRLLTDLDNKADETDAARARVAPPPPATPASSASAAAANDAIARAKEANDISARIDTELANLRTLLIALQTAKTNLDGLISTEEMQDNWCRQLLRGISNVGGYFGAQPLSTTAICPQRKTQLTGANAITDGIEALQKALNRSVETAKDQAVQARIAQLMQEGHGPQRHSSAASTAAVKARACFNIDPAGGDQTEHGAVPPRLHNCAATSTRVRNDRDYLNAEATMRQRLMAQVCPGGVAPPPPPPPQPGVAPPAPPPSRVKVEVPLNNLFANPDAACEGYKDTIKGSRAEVMTSLGVAVQVPTVAGVPPFRPFGIKDPPANPPNHPFAFPQPPQQQSNARKKIFTTAAERAVAQGRDPQHVMDLMNTNSPPPATNQTLMASTAQALAAAAPFAPPPLRAPPTGAQLDHVRINADAAAATTVPATFSRPEVGVNQPPVVYGKMTALYEVVNPAIRCGEWKLVTMFPEPV